MSNLNKEMKKISADARAIFQPKPVGTGFVAHVKQLDDFVRKAFVHAVGENHDWTERWANTDCEATFPRLSHNQVQKQSSHICKHF